MSKSILISSDFSSVGTFVFTSCFDKKSIFDISHSVRIRLINLVVFLLSSLVNEDISSRVKDPMCTSMMADIPTDYCQDEIRLMLSFVEDSTEVSSNNSTNNRNELISTNRILKKFVVFVFIRTKTKIVFTFGQFGQLILTKF